MNRRLKLFTPLTVAAAGLCATLDPSAPGHHLAHHLAHQSACLRRKAGMSR